MARTDVQISAIVSTHTKELVEKYSRASGVKKGHLVEMALLHHLRALHELPSDVIVPPRIVVQREFATELAALMEHPPKPTKAMKELMRGD
jgi:hypothetical protein